MLLVKPQKGTLFIEVEPTIFPTQNEIVRKLYYITLKQV